MVIKIVIHWSTIDMPAASPRHRLKRLIASAIMLAVAVPTIAAAQVKTDKPEQATADLNRQQAAASTAQNEANRNNGDSFVQGVQDYEAQRTAVARARVDYEAALEAHRQQQAAYDAAYARWQADVAACNAGDRSRCSTAAPAPK